MPWVRIDDAFYDHPKWIEAGPLAGWLGMCALAWCNRNLTDGFIPGSKIQLLADFRAVATIESCNNPDDFRVSATRIGPYELADRLVELGLWEAAEGGYKIHGYLEYQRSAAQIRDLAEKRAEAGRKGGAAKRQQNVSKPQAQPHIEKEQKRSRPREDFVPTERHSQFCLEHGLALEQERAHWLEWCEAHGKTFVSQNAGFATWLRQAVAFGRGGRPVVTLEELAEPVPVRGPWVCSAGNPECHDGWIDVKADGKVWATSCVCTSKDLAGPFFGSG